MSQVQVSVASDLYVAGPHFEGGDYTAELYYVVVEYAQGARIRHEANFKGAELCTDEEFDGEPFYRDVRQAAEAEAEALAAKVRKAIAAGRDLDASRWRDMEPAYGSEAYQLAYC